MPCGKQLLLYGEIAQALHDIAEDTCPLQQAQSVLHGGKHQMTLSSAGQQIGHGQQQVKQHQTANRQTGQLYGPLLTVAETEKAE